MKKIIISVALILSAGNSVGANNYVLSYDAQQIEHGNYPQLTVWSGSGLTLNLTALKGESVKSLWLDDPSKLVVDYAGELCSVPCRGGVKVIHLKRITGLNFAHLPATARTTLTVVTVSGAGDKVYKFILGYGGGTPKYLAVNLTPPFKQRPLPPLFHRRQLPPPVKPAPTAKVDLERINLLKKGLQVARQKLKPTTRNQLLFDRFELLISQLESGAEEEDARQRHSISANALQLVADFGLEQKISARKEQENNYSASKPSTKTAPVPQREIMEPKNSGAAAQPPPQKQVSIAQPEINQEQKSVLVAKAKVKVEQLTPQSVEGRSDSVLPKTNQTTQPEKLNPVTQEPPNSRQMANDIVRGLIVAANKKQINYGTTTYRQVQSAVRALRREKTLEEAADMAKIKLSLLEQLLIWGQQ